MAYQLYPPTIPGSLPAIQLIDETTTSTAITRTYKFSIPFKINRSVGWNDISGFSLKIKNKTLQSISTPVLTTTDASVIAQAKNTNIVEFEYTISTAITMEIVPEEYYKIQLAFINKAGMVGYYSTVGYAKCVAMSSFDVRLNNIKNNNILQAVGKYNISFVGKTYNYTVINKDKSKTTIAIPNTESPYSYQYAIIYTTSTTESNNLKQKKWNYLTSSSIQIAYKSEEILYNSNILNVIEYRTDLVTQDNVFLLFRLKTNNNVYIDSIYTLKQNYTIDTSLKAILTAEAKYEDGFVNIHLDGSGYAKINYTLLRSNKNDNPYSWLKLKEIILGNEINDEPIYDYKDFLIEHGNEYIYAVEYQIGNNNKLYRLYSNSITPEFEDMFLLDAAGRQLKIRYNPKVSTFRQNILEQKIDTIGGQYPSFFRNGRVKYKEFALSGLISYQMDNNELFYIDEDLGLEKDLSYRDESKIDVINELYIDNTRRSNLDDRNMYAERIFKRGVQDWLGNGEVKLLKTPAEGTFLVRLINISLSPEDRLSRMLHSFSCSAYEVGALNQNDLKKFGFLIDSDIEVIEGSYKPDNTLVFKLVPKDINKNGKVILTLSNGSKIDAESGEYIFTSANGSNISLDISQFD